ncbi:hypothetical protein DFQ29_003746 [Apophysomyces sp. BC1021]|nr:hypothetical protein DFQ29_003746 [Apophysomyces sp. BC1021]
MLRPLTRSIATLRATTASVTAKVKRPTPIVLLETHASKDWSATWQNRLSQLGYSSTSIHLENDTLDGHYKDLTQATKHLSFFPPLLIGYGDITWRVCQKYVSNQPVSALVLVEQQNAPRAPDSMPSHEFEPHFPIFMVSQQAPPPFLDGLIDHEQGRDDEALDRVVGWMEDVGL